MTKTEASKSATKRLTIRHDGEEWFVVNTGAVRDGKVYCHMASPTRGLQQRNGWSPMQIADWVDADLVVAWLTKRNHALENALHDVSLCSQNSASSKEECGQIARAAIAAATGSAQ